MPYVCNLKCQNCRLWKANYRKLRGEYKDQIKKEDVYLIQERISKIGIKRISYIGGEPFLERNIYDIASNAISNSVRTAAVTNGNALDNKSIEKICEKNLFESIVFSLDGPENIHDFIRGKKGAFTKLFSNMKAIQRIKNSFKKRFPKVYIYCTVSKLNYKYIEETYKIALSVNANMLRFQLASCINENIISQTNSVLGFEAVKTHSYINSNSLSKEELGKVAKSIRKIKSMKFSMKIEAESCLEGKENSICHFIGKDMVITPSGNVLICPMLTNWHAGNIKNMEISKILEKAKEKSEEIKRMAENKVLPICRECCVEKIR